MMTFSYCSIFIYFMVILYEPRVSGTGAWAQLHKSNGIIILYFRKQQKKAKLPTVFVSKSCHIRRAYFVNV
jgi:hypothetical protein